MEAKIFQNLVADIASQLADGWKSVRTLESLSYAYDQSDSWEEEQEYELQAFASIVKRIYISLSLLLESMGNTELLKEFRCGYNEFKGKEANIRSIPFTHEPHSDALSYLWSYHRTISSLFNEDAKESDESQQRSRFAAILQNTPKIVNDRGIEPENEADVRQCVYDLLIHVFPDTVREIPIAQVTKTYKPDIGVRSLKTAAEYKYATTQDEAKKVIGGFYEDMRGYAGSEDWKFFYAVVYMSQPFFTVQQIQAEFDLVGVNKNWVPILVHGFGSRKSKIK